MRERAGRVHQRQTSRLKERTKQRQKCPEKLLLSLGTVDEHRSTGGLTKEDSSCNPLADNQTLTLDLVWAHIFGYNKADYYDLMRGHGCKHLLEHHLNRLCSGASLSLSFSTIHKSLILCGRDLARSIAWGAKERGKERNGMGKETAAAANVSSKCVFQQNVSWTPWTCPTWQQQQKQRQTQTSPAYHFRPGFFFSLEFFFFLLLHHFYCLLNLLRFVCSSLSLSLTLTRHSIIGITKAKVKVKEEEEWRRRSPEKWKKRLSGRWSGAFRTFRELCSASLPIKC